MTAMQPPVVVVMGVSAAGSPRSPNGSACRGFAHRTGAPELLAVRAAAPRGHFMPASLLESQQAALECLDADEPGRTFDVAPSAARIAEASVAWVRSDA